MANGRPKRGFCSKRESIFPCSRAEFISLSDSCAFVMASSNISIKAFNGICADLSFSKVLSDSFTSCSLVICPFLSASRVSLIVYNIFFPTRHADK